MLHPAWERIARQTLLAAVVVGVLAMIYGLYHEEQAPRSHDIILTAPQVGLFEEGQRQSAAAGTTRLQTPDIADLHVRGPRYWRLQPCGQSQRVAVGGALLPSGTAISPAGTCLLQTWCDSPLLQAADGHLICRRDGRVMVGWAGTDVPAQAPSNGAQTGRCATVTAACSRRARFELSSVLVELWPPPDGSAAVAMFCGPGVFRVPTTNLSLDPGCTLTRLVLSDSVASALAETPRVTIDDQTFEMADITATTLSDEWLVVTVHASGVAASFCLRWFFWPLAVRGARLAAVGAFSMPGRPLMGSTTCVALPSEPATASVTLLLLTDAMPSAMGVQVGIGPAIGPVAESSTRVDNTLPLAYRLVASHGLAVLVPPRFTPFALYDTNGTLRALVPPDSPRFPAILLDGWRPRCSDCTIVFADTDSAPASLCYTLEGGARIVSPVGASTRLPILTHMVGETLRTSLEPPVALIGTSDSLPQLVLPQELAIASSSSITCGMNAYRVPAEPLPEIYCMPTAGVHSVGAISRVWVNSSAELHASVSFSDCDLMVFHTDLGFQIAPEPCVPMTPGSSISYSSVSICASASGPEGQSAASAEVTRQLGLQSPLFAVVDE